jgi:hypothetical protein
MKSLILVLGLLVLPFTRVAHSAEIADESDKHLEKFYDINMEVLVLGEITAAPRIILKVGGSGSIELSSENDNYLIAVQTEPPQIESGVPHVPISFDLKYETAGEPRIVNTSMNLPLGQMVSLVGKTKSDGEVQLNASINVIAEAPSW